MSRPGLFEGLREEVLDSLPAGSAVLDYGSGSGMVSARFLEKGHRVTAMDIGSANADRILEKCDEGMRTRLEFVRVDPLADILRVDPLGERRFSLIVCREVLEHVANPWKVLEFFNRHLEAGGTAVISFPAARMESWLDRRDPDWLRKSGHCRIIDPHAFVEKARERGFAVRHHYGAGAEWSLLWAMLAPFRFPHAMGNPSGPLAPLGRWLARRCTSLRRIPRLLEALNRRIPKSVVFELEKVGPAAAPAAQDARKPTVLLVYDYRDWILYLWAAQIREIWRDQFDFVAFSMFHAARDRELRRRLVNAADVVHLLLPNATEVFRDSLDERFIGTVHHWIDYATAEPTVASIARIVTGAEEWKDRMVERGVDPSRITVVHSGAPPEFFAGPPRTARRAGKIRAGFSAKADSNEQDRKGSRHFASLVALCAGSPYRDRVEFVITGPGWEDIVRDLRAAGAQIDYRPRVPQAMMPDLMRGLDVYLMLSDVEGGPATVAEAMAAGCIVIATRIGLARDFIEHGKSGFFVENADTAGIFGILTGLIESPGAMAAVGNAAAQLASAELRYSSTLAPLGALYAEVARAAAGLRSTSLGKRDLEACEERNYALAPSAWKN